MGDHARRQRTVNARGLPGCSGIPARAESIPEAGARCGAGRCTQWSSERSEDRPDCPSDAGSPSCVAVAPFVGLLCDVVGGPIGRELPDAVNPLSR